MPPKNTAAATAAAAAAAVSAAATPATTDAKLDALLVTVDSIARSQQELARSQQEIKLVQDESKALLESSLQRMDKLEQRMDTLTENQSAASADLAAHDRDITSLIIASNANDQLHRANNIRILGYPVLEDEITAANDGGKHLREKIFSRIIKPVLDVAVRDRFLLSPPSEQEVIVRIFRAGRPSTGDRSPPPPILVVFSSYAYRQALFRYKAKALPAPNTVEKSAGAKRFYVVEDLTKPAHRLLKLLQADERIAKVWSTDGYLRYTRPDNDTVFKVPNVFATVEKILER